MRFVQLVSRVCPVRQLHGLMICFRIDFRRFSEQRDGPLVGDDWRQTSPKTKKQGKPWRVVPLFPELRPHLEDTLALVANETEFSINRYRDKGVCGPRQKLRQQVLRFQTFSMNTE